MENSRFSVLFKRAIAKTISPEEREELFVLIADPSNKAEAKKLFANAWDKFIPTHSVFTEKNDIQMLRRILENEKDEVSKTGKHRSLYSGLAWAAAAVIFFGISTLFISYFKDKQRTVEVTLAQAVKQYGIEPGSNKAMLTLGNGQIVVLNEAANGLVAKEHGVDIVKADSGQLRYNQGGKMSAAITYNSISIPKGGQYRVVLPDGTMVHLNAESSLRYPTRFITDRREVELTGEGYFEVTRNKKQPFYVKTATQVIRVFGTVFNINAYGKDITTTTLLEGSVKVSRPDGQSIVLVPGQTALNDSKHSNLLVMNANTDEVMAWHNGYFIFNDENIKSIMQRIARWYNIDVEYQGDMTNKQFGGVFQRSKSIAQLLENFKETGIIDFKITGRRVIVMGN